MSLSLFKLGYLTEHVPVKAGMAASAVLIERLCAIFAPTCYILESIHLSVRALLVLMLIDLVTGVLAARHEGQRINSRRFSLGAKRKVVMLLVVYAATTLDQVFGTGSAIFIGATWWFIGAEAISLFENSERLGVPLPPGMRTLLERTRSRVNRSLEALVSSEEELPKNEEPDA